MNEIHNKIVPASECGSGTNSVSTITESNTNQGFTEVSCINNKQLFETKNQVKRTKYEAVCTIENFNIDSYNEQQICCQELANRIIKLQLPELLNSRNAKNEANKHSVSMIKKINNSLYEVCRDFMLSSNYKISKKKKVLFIINLTNENFTSFIPDTDNRNYTGLINVFKQFFVPDDSPNYLSFYMDTIITNSKPCTVCYLCTYENILENIPIIQNDLNLTKSH
ncbi:MAG: hypothetical protein ACI37Z_03310 [Candidatus Gastranaerophilaceae bacterium]